MNLPPPIAEKVRVNIRWMMTRHHPEVFAIEAVSHEAPWSKADFVGALRHRDCICMVAELDEQVVGYMVYRLDGPTIHVLNFAVDPGHRRRRVGAKMLAKLRAKLCDRGRQRLVLTVPETSGAMCRFLREMDVRAIGVERGAFGSRDGYVFVDEVAREGVAA